MNYYPHHIGDFNNATRHLTRVERALYRELIELYYDTEQPLPAGDLGWICKKVLAASDEEKAAVMTVLGEFFEKDGDFWRHDRCDREIAAYREKHEAAVRAGKASAESRLNAKSARTKRTSSKRSTDVQPTKNQEPRTNNQELTSLGSRNCAPHPQIDISPVIETLPIIGGGSFEVRQSLVSEVEPLCPNVDVPVTLREMKLWLVGNPERRKTVRGMRKFISGWLSREQQKWNEMQGGR